MTALILGAVLAVVVLVILTTIRSLSPYDRPEPGGGHQRPTAS